MLNLGENFPVKEAMIKLKWALVAVLFLTVCTARAQENWELRRDENGIKIYSRKKEGSKLLELRLLTRLNATQDQVMDAMLNVDNYSRWIYSNKKSTLIKRVNDHDIIYYTETRLPWPVQDRDLVTELTITPATATTPLTMQAKSIQGVMALNKNYIRVPYSSAVWHVVPTADNKIDIDYDFTVDPGGSIPSWLLNMTITKGPYESFLKLADLLKQSRIKDNSKELAKRTEIASAAIAE